VARVSLVSQKFPPSLWLPSSDPDRHQEVQAADFPEKVITVQADVLGGQETRSQS
jgi:hypothetical protein